MTRIAPQLPPALHCPAKAALEKDRLRRIPSSFLPPVQQGCREAKEGAILLGDSWNMRHPLTGGGMTVALHDVVIFTSLIGAIPDFSDWEEVKQALYKWHWVRKPLSSTLNILSVALYDLFGAEGRTSCSFTGTLQLTLSYPQTSNWPYFVPDALNTLNEVVNV